MKIPWTNIEIGKITNVDKKQNERERIENLVTEQQLYRETENIKKWRDALISAEMVPNPDCSALIRIFNEARLDAQVTAVIGTRINKLLATKWVLKDANGDINKEATALIDRKWFQDIRKYINEAQYYGFSLIQLGPIINDQFTDITIVPRQNVIAKYKGLNPTTGSYAADELIKFKEKPYQYWCIWADTGEFGLLTQVAPHAIWKKNSLGFWARYLELFGMPVRLGKTDIADKARKANMSTMLANMTSAAWATFDSKDTIEFIQNNGTSGNAIYKSMAEFNNSEISKIILGQTMTTDNGSSRSQAEVHERVLDVYLQADQHFEQGVMNSEVLPILEFHRLIPAGLKFEHVNYESMEIKLQKITAVKELTVAGFIIDPVFVEGYIGIDIAGVGVPIVPGQKEPNNIIKEVNALYANYFKKVE